MTKEVIRKKYKNIRDNLPDHYRKTASLIISKFILEIVMNLKFKEEAQRIIAGYYPIGSEVDILYALSHLEKVHSPFLLSLPTFDSTNDIFSFKTWSYNLPLKINRFGIPEPVYGEQICPNVALIPLLAFDMNFNRLGYGKGYYDKMLVDTSIVKIGCAFSVQQTTEIPYDYHDISMDMIVTERGVLRKKCT